MNKPNHYIHKKQPATHGYGSTFFYMKNFYLVRCFFCLAFSTEDDLSDLDGFLVS